MPRLSLLLLLAVTCAATGRTVARPVNPMSRIGFTLRPAMVDRLHLSLRADRTNMSSDCSPASLIGLEAARLTQDGATTGFAMVAQPGRLDCAGASNGAAATGDCRYTADPTFGTFLASRGIRLRDDRQSLQLALTGVTRELVQALADAHYPAPTADELAGMAALGVTRGYIEELSRAGYHHLPVSRLGEMRALGTSQEALRIAGYSGTTHTDDDQ